LPATNANFSQEFNCGHWPVPLHADRALAPRGPVAQASACAGLFWVLRSGNTQTKSAQAEVCATKTRVASKRDTTHQLAPENRKPFRVREKCGLTRDSCKYPAKTVSAPGRVNLSAESLSTSSVWNPSSRTIVRTYPGFDSETAKPPVNAGDNPFSRRI
jgi:hypothetical protein